MGDGQNGTAVSVSLTIAWIEGRNLVHLIDEFVGLVSGPREGADPALDRLAPPVYPDDDAAAAEFRLRTESELFDRRRADALTMRGDLDGLDTDDAMPRDVLAPHEVEVPTGHIDAWLRTLAAVRLVVASRLGIERDDRHDADDPRFQVYDWLGYRLDDLIQRADEADATDSATG